MDDTDFLFINETPRLLSQEGNANATAIRRFVRKNRKARKAKSLSPSRLWTFPKPAIPAYTSDLRDAQSQIAGIVSTYHELDNPSNHMSLSLQYHQAAARRVGSNSPNVLQTYRPIDTGFDPFYVAPVRISSDIHTLLSYYEAVMEPMMILWSHRVSAVSNAHKLPPAGNRVLSAAFHDDLSMKCLLAACVARLCHVDKVLEVKYQELENDYISCALQLMRRSLDQAISSPHLDHIELTQNILLLSSTEAYRGNIPEALVHFRASVHLITQSDVALTELGEDVLRGNVIILDQFFACLNLERCLFEPESPTLAELNLHRIEMQVTAPRLAQMTASFNTTPHVSDDIKALVSQIKDACLVLCSLETSTADASRRKQINKWLRTKCTAIRTGLLSAFKIPYSQLSPSAMVDLEDRDRVEIAVRIALILFTFLVMEGKKQVTLGGPLAPRLRRFIEPLLQRHANCLEICACGGDMISLVLWIAVIGISCAVDGTETKSWFEENAYMIIAPKIKLYSKLEKDHETLLYWLEQSQIRYLYYAPGQRSCLERLLRAPTQLERMELRS